MSESDVSFARDSELWPQCDCGYTCQGHTPEERLRDGQRHAREAHGIEVSPEQIALGAAAQPTVPPGPPDQGASHEKA